MLKHILKSSRIVIKFKFKCKYLRQESIHFVPKYKVGGRWLSFDILGCHLWVTKLPLSKGPTGAMGMGLDLLLEDFGFG